MTNGMAIISKNQFGAISEKLVIRSITSKSTSIAYLKKGGFLASTT
jgi:hypothetical protein